MHFSKNIAVAGFFAVAYHVSNVNCEGEASTSEIVPTIPNDAADFGVPTVLSTFATVTHGTHTVSDPTCIAKVEECTSTITTWEDLSPSVATPIVPTAPDHSASMPPSISFNSTITIPELAGVTAKAVPPRDIVGSDPPITIGLPMSDFPAFPTRDSSDCPTITGLPMVERDITTPNWDFTFASTITLPEIVWTTTRSIFSTMTWHDRTGSFYTTTLSKQVSTTVLDPKYNTITTAAVTNQGDALTTMMPVPISNVSSAADTPITDPLMVTVTWDVPTATETYTTTTVLWGKATTTAPGWLISSTFIPTPTGWLSGNPPPPTEIRSDMTSSQRSVQWHSSILTRPTEAPTTFQTVKRQVESDVLETSSRRSLKWHSSILTRPTEAPTPFQTAKREVGSDGLA